MEVTLIKSSVSTIFKIISILIVLVLIFINFDGCDKKIELPRTNNDSLLYKIRRDSLLIVKLEEAFLNSEKKQDSLEVLKGKFESKLKASSKLVRVQISEGICDTNSVKIALNDCDSTNNVNNKIITEKDSAISILIEISTKQKEDLAAAKKVMSNQANDYSALEEEYNKLASKHKKTKVKIIALAVLAELVTIFALK